jgi:hypothetical protein
MESQHQIVKALQHTHTHTHTSRYSQEGTEKSMQKWKKIVSQQGCKVKQHGERSQSDGWPHSLTTPSYCTVHQSEEESIWETGVNISDIRCSPHRPWRWRRRRLFLVQQWHGWSPQRVIAHIFAAKASNLTTPIDLWNICITYIFNFIISSIG